MFGKRGLSKGRCNNKAQVTVFIILGIVILASVMFLMYIISQTTTDQLTSEHEKAVTKSFQKEGLRLYVEDCLHDSLEEGLELIGQQGRIWDGQPGGTLTYVNKENGLEFTYDEFARVFYGITYSEQDPENSYPCDQNITNPPDFCRYMTGDDGDFGTKEKLTKSNIESDLRNYMINESVACVQEFIYSNLSIASNILVEDIELDLSIEPDGIMVIVEYPLELYSENEVFFYMSDFSFIYLSEISDFLSHAMTKPLYYEQNDVTYNLTEETLLGSNTYDELSPTFTRFEWGDGDNVFRFELDSGVVLKHEDYVFQYAIQNRPPALDYISRDSCGGYDYLAIQDYETEYGLINITPFAMDPDEDNVSYSYESSNLLSGYNVLINPYDYFYMDLSNYNLNPGFYNLTVYAEDEHGLMDWQVVRVLLDRNMEVDVSISTPYEDFTSGTATVSVEDPVFVRLHVPEDSVDEETYERLILDYDGNNGENFSIEAHLDPGEQCISLPNDDGSSGLNCDVGTYSESDLSDWDTSFLNTLTFPYFQQLTDTGVMEVTFTANYCSQYQQKRDDHINVNVQECIEYDGVETDEGKHSYPYVPGMDYHNYVFDADGNLQFGPTNEPIMEEISPFLANHVCCEDGNYASNETICFSTEPGCYGNLQEGYISPNYPGHYVHEEIVTYCSGDRGNICGDGSGQGEAKLFENRLVCGKNNYNGCHGIHEDCQEQDAWGIIEGSNNQKYWCHGEMGCQYACYDEIVYIGDVESNCDLGDYCDISSQIESFSPTTNEELNFVCGCYDSNVEDQDVCDSDLDGTFEGKCFSGTCVT